MKCEKCGASMVEYHEGHSVGFNCPNCGWGIATSYFEPHELDLTVYSIIVQGNKVTPATVKAIASIANVNFVQAKKLMEMPEAIVFEGNASSILKKRAILDSAGIAYRITPEFQY